MIRSIGRLGFLFASAGNFIDETKYTTVIKEACLRGTFVLQSGGTALDACEACIMRLENSGNTNAGFGSNLTWDGNIECEASIMDGASLHFGACSNVSSVKNPIQLARRICNRQGEPMRFDRIQPMIINGAGAEFYAKGEGLPIVDPASLVSTRARRSYEHYKSKIKRIDDAYTAQISSFDTVGAICVDEQGNISAGCSSGGLLLKSPGRVGQAACFAAGCWAQCCSGQDIGVCTTGNGEYLIRTLLAKEIATDLVSSECPTTSLYHTFREKFLKSELLPKGKELYGGALSIIFNREKQEGEFLWSHTTKSLCIGYMSTHQKTPKVINSSLPTYSKPGESIVVSGQHFGLINSQ